MTDWGFNIVTGRLIDFENNDFSVAEFVSRHEPSFRWCIGCGSCTATCSAAQFTDFNPRKIHQSVQRGETATLDADSRRHDEELRMKSPNVCFVENASLFVQEA